MILPLNHPVNIWRIGWNRFFIDLKSLQFSMQNPFLFFISFFFLAFSISPSRRIFSSWYPPEDGLQVILAFFFKSYSSGFVFWSSSYSSSSSSSYSSSSSSLQQQSVPSCGYFTPHFDYCTSDGYYPVFWVLYRPLSTVVHHVMAMINLIKNLFYRKSNHLHIMQREFTMRLQM